MESFEKKDDYIHTIDQHFMGKAKTSSCYLIKGDKIALYDAGPTAVLEKVLNGIKEIGYNPEDISALFCSHVHMDHSAGAGTLCRELPNLRVYVHENGAEHLKNPERLTKSMLRVFGQELTDQFYGEMVPVPEDRIHPLKDGEIVDLGHGVSYRVIFTPGHAGHHLALYDENNKTIFAGEGLGIYFGEDDVYFPSTPPPEFDLGLAVQSIIKLEQLDCDKIYFSHFGPAKDPKQALQKSKELLISWGRAVGNAMQDSDDKEYIFGELLKESMHCLDHLDETSDAYAKYKEMNQFRCPTACGPGYYRYFKKGGKMI